MEKATVLVVEDEGIIARNLQHMLQRLGYAVPRVASSGEEAISLVDKLRPDLVLLDIVLGGQMDGIEAAELIRARYDIPVIFSTAYGDDKTLRRAQATGPFGYILKPFAARDLDTNIQMALYKHEAEARLRRNQAYYRALLENAWDMVAILDRDGVVRYASPAHHRALAYSPDELVGRDVGELLHPDDLPELERRFSTASIREDEIEIIEARFRHGDGSWRVIEAMLHYRLTDPLVQGVIVNSRDVTARKEIEQERENLIAELEQALVQVKALSGLLPICSICKKIRDDQGYWNQLECYIRDHSEAEFTHSICPGCAKEHYPDLYDE